jgi:fatty-acyl-CoA synthase
MNDSGLAADEALTPLGFLERSATLFAERRAVIDGDRVWTYRELHERVRRQAGLLRARGVVPGDRVAVLALNNSLLLEAHYGVPLAGAALVALNTRLAVGELQYILDHSGARLLVLDEAHAHLAGELSVPEKVIGSAEYEALLATAEPEGVMPDDEWSLVAVDYTSGTTGRPKGVMYHHRGAYLQSLAMAFHTGLGLDSVFLWTLPMFHCNGWCFTWAVTAAGGTHLCLPRIVPATVWDLIERHGVTHFNAAPTVLAMLAEDPGAQPGRVRRPITVATGGAPPSPALLERLANLDMQVIHLYGLTETFGPVAIRQLPPEADRLDSAQRAVLIARQGGANIANRRLRVVDDLGSDVPADGSTMGQVAVRGGTVMLGYLHDEAATRAAIPDGWFRTGDLGVMHPDGSIELRDRSKDVIISGGENIASIEVEQVLDSHPAVLESAVVAAPDAFWGEVPVAFVTLRPGAVVEPEELIAHVRTRLARFKAPKRFEFGPLPKTATGKIQKFVLRQRIRPPGAETGPA